MTNQTIHPCPKCEVVPEVDLCYTPTSVVVCCQLHPAYSVDTVLWVDLCDLHLGRACRELGIETVEQLKALAKGAHCIVCGNDSGSYGEQYWTGEEMDVTEVQCEWCWTEPNSIFNRRRIAAQRGDG